MNDNTTVSVILFKPKVLKNGEHPLMLRITQNRDRKYRSLGISCHADMWDSKNHRPKNNHPDKLLLKKIISDKLAEFDTQILQFKSDKKDFTQEALLNAVEKPVRKTTVFKYYDEIINRFKTESLLGNATVYKESKKSLMGFIKRDIKFSEIDNTFLLDYETHLRKKGLKGTTMSFYFRTLRSVYNKAIKSKICRENSYPFKDYEISKFKLETKRLAVSKDAIKQIEALSIPENSKPFLARQIFLFSYYGQGITFSDIAHLKWENIIGDRLYYRRKKTGKEINFKLLEPAQNIIEHWKPLTAKSRDSYIFPILNNEVHISPTQIKHRINKVIGQTNKALKEIGEKIAIGCNLTTYVARHTFATTLKRNGVSPAIISEAMRHGTESETQIYLKTFENDVLDEAMKNLL